MNRRTFLAGASAAALLHNAPALAWSHGSGSVANGRFAQVNLNGLFPQFNGDYATINIFKTFGDWKGDGTGDYFSLLSADGYPTGFLPGGFQWQSRGNIYYPGVYATFTATLSGTNTMTVTSSVTGTALAIGQTVRGTGIPNGTRIASGSGTVWTLSNTITTGSGISCIADIPWVMDGRTGTDAFLSLADNGQGITLTTVTISADRTEIHLQPYAGCTFSGSMSGSSTMVVSSVTGTIAQRTYGTPLQGPGIPPFSMLLDNGGGGGAGNYLLSDMSGGIRSVSYSVSGTYTIPATPAGAHLQCSVLIRTITATPTNLRLYRQDEEALLSTQTASPAFKNYYSKYGRVRYLNWQGASVTPLAQWIQRPRESAFSFAGVSCVAALYAGIPTQTLSASGTNDYSSTATIPCLDTNGNNVPNPTSWINGMMVQTQITNTPAAISVSSVANGNPVSITAPSHGLSTGAKVIFSLDGASSLNGKLNSGTNVLGDTWQIGAYQITVVDANTLTLNGVNSISSFTGSVSGNVLTVTGTVTGVAITNGTILSGAGIPAGTVIQALLSGTPGGAGTYQLSNSATVSSEAMQAQWDTSSTSGMTMYQQIRFKCGALPYKPVIYAFLVGSGFFSTSMTQLAAGHIQTLVYDAAMDVLVLNTDMGFGASIETMCKLANDCGYDPWIHLYYKADNYFVTQQATLIKSTLNSNRKWCVELANENWNTQSVYNGWYSTFECLAQFPGVTSDQIKARYSWFGMRFGQTMALIEAVYGASLSSQVTRILGFKEDDVRIYHSNPSVIKPFLDYISFATMTSPPSSPMSHADQICIATYWTVDFSSQAQADQAIGTYKTAFLANDTAGMNTALAFIDNDYQADVTNQYNIFTAGPQYLSDIGFSGIKMTAYEGGWSALTDASGLGGNGGTYLGVAYNSLDHLNYFIGYQSSSLWAATWKQQIQKWELAGDVYYSQFQSTQVYPGPGSMWAITYQNVFGATWPGKAMYDQYNAGVF